MELNELSIDYKHPINIDGKNYINVEEYIYNKGDLEIGIKKKLDTYKQLLHLLLTKDIKPLFTNKYITTIYYRIKNSMLSNKLSEDVNLSYKIFFVNKKVTNDMLKNVNLRLLERPYYSTILDKEKEFGDIKITEAYQDKVIENVKHLLLSFTFKKIRFYIDINNFSLMFTSKMSIDEIYPILVKFRNGTLFCSKIHDKTSLLAKEINNAKIIKELINTMDNFFYSKNMVFFDLVHKNYNKIRSLFNKIMFNQISLGETIIPNKFIIPEDIIVYLEKKFEDVDIKKILQELDINKLMVSLKSTYQIKNVCKDLKINKRKGIIYIENLSIKESKYNEFKSKKISDEMIYTLLIRYYETMYQDNMQLAIKYDDAMIKAFNLEIEGFASPLNNTFKKYYSAFYDIDQHFESKGSFFNIKEWEETCYAINPPFDISLMNNMSSFIVKALNTNKDKKLSFLIFILRYISDNNVGNDDYQACTNFKMTPFLKYSVEIPDDSFIFVNQELEEDITYVSHMYVFYLSTQDITTDQKKFLDALYTNKPNVDSKKYKKKNRYLIESYLVENTKLSIYEIESMSDKNKLKILRQIVKNSNIEKILDGIKFDQNDKFLVIYSKNKPQLNITENVVYTDIRDKLDMTNKYKFIYIKNVYTPEIYTLLETGGYLIVENYDVFSETFKGFINKIDESDFLQSEAELNKLIIKDNLFKKIDTKLNDKITRSFFSLYQKF